jgi:hypothetical protein
MDVGAEYANYSSDMTRTIPVNGRFTERQKTVYNAVLNVKNEVTKLLRPGILWSDYHKEVGKIMTSELLRIKLLGRDRSNNTGRNKSIEIDFTDDLIQKRRDSLRKVNELKKESLQRKRDSILKATMSSYYLKCSQTFSIRCYHIVFFQHINKRVSHHHRYYCNWPYSKNQ